MFEFDVVCDDRHDYANGPHAHADDMLFVPVDGFFAVSSPEIDKADVLTNNSIWWVPHRCVHQVTASQAQRHLCYYFDMQALLSASHIDMVQKANEAQRWSMSAYLVDLLRVRHHLGYRRPNPTVLSQTMLDRAILMEFARLVGTVLSTKEPQPELTIQAIKAYIHSHLDENLKCSALADHFNLSPRTLARWFQDVEGTSIGQYVLQARLNEARVQLQSTTLPVSDIQSMVGFASATHFSYAIRRAFGYPPLQLRERVLRLAKNR